MFNRRRLNRERLEIYLVHLILAYRRLLFTLGWALLLYAYVMMSRSLLAGGIILVLALFLFLLFYSYRAVVLVARVGAWIGILVKKE